MTRSVFQPKSAEGTTDGLPLAFVNGLLDNVEGPLVVLERDGRVLLVNQRGKKYLEPSEGNEPQEVNFFRDVLRADPEEIFRQI